MSRPQARTATPARRWASARRLHRTTLAGGCSHRYRSQGQPHTRWPPLQQQNRRMSLPEHGWGPLD
eukprot:937329-Prorocentrum_minimum.AAC.2